MASIVNIVRSKIMKKMYIVLGILLLLIPIKINALGVTSVRISNDQTAMTGDTITVSFYLGFNGVSPKDDNSFGIGGVVFDLEYDHDALMYMSAEASGFASAYVQIDGEEVISSIISGEDILSNSCADDILYCGEYGVTLKFYVRDTDLDSTQIKINEVAILGWQLENGSHPTYDEDDMTGFESTVNKVHTVTIKKVEVKTEEPTEVKASTNTETEKVISNIATEKVENKEVISVDSEGKSNNNYLKKLDPKGYILNFYKRNNKYDLAIEKGDNELELEVVPENDKATYEVKGDKDIKGNNNKIQIIVTSESGKKNTYTINITYENDDNKKISKFILIDKFKDIFKQYKLYFYIAGGVVLLIIVMIVIINAVSNKKINKELNDL